MAKKDNKNNIVNNASEKKNNSGLLYFAEKRNSTTLFFIAVMSAIVVFIACILMFSNKKYMYLPDYEELSYSEEVNPGIIIISAYNNVEDTDTKEESLVKTNRVILSFGYSEKENRNFTASDIRCNYIGVLEDGDYEYLSEHYDDDSLPNASVRTHQFTSTKSGSKCDYKSIYGEFMYKYTSNDGAEEVKTIEYKKDMLELTDADLEAVNLEDEENNVNNFSEYPDFFSTYTTYQELGTTDNTTKKIYATLTLKIANLTKYVFDYQLFAIDEDGDVFPMVGYYNISTKVKYQYSRSTAIPSDFNVKYLVGKGVLKYEENNEAKELVLYSKKIVEA